MKYREITNDVTFRVLITFLSQICHRTLYCRIISLHLQTDDKVKSDIKVYTL